MWATAYHGCNDAVDKRNRWEKYAEQATMYNTLRHQPVLGSCIGWEGTPRTEHMFAQHAHSLRVLLLHKRIRHQPQASDGGTSILIQQLQLRPRLQLLAKHYHCQYLLHRGAFRQFLSLHHQQHLSVKHSLSYTRCDKAELVRISSHSSCVTASAPWGSVPEKPCTRRPAAISEHLNCV